MADIEDRCRPWSLSLNREFFIEPQTILIQSFLLHVSFHFISFHFLASQYTRQNKTKQIVTMAFDCIQGPNTRSVKGLKVLERWC